jgi:hypothetical protein
MTADAVDSFVENKGYKKATFSVLLFYNNTKIFTGTTDHLFPGATSTEDIRRKFKEWVAGISRTKEFTSMVVDLQVEYSYSSISNTKRTIDLTAYNVQGVPLVKQINTALNDSDI